MRSFFDYASELELKVPLAKRPYQGNKKAYVLLEEARASKLLNPIDKSYAGYHIGSHIGSYIRSYIGS